MTFYIRRTSSYDDEKQPYKNATKVGEITKDFSNDTISFWQIDIETLEELLTIIKETGSPIIIDFESWAYRKTQNHMVKDIPEIEIYDGYRE